MSSNVNAFWNAASWSSSPCCTNLSPTPNCLRNISVVRVMNSRPQTPYSSAVRKAATTTPRSIPTVIRSTW